jgi:hypothetical protein
LWAYSPRYYRCSRRYLVLRDLHEFDRSMIRAENEAVVAPLAAGYRDGLR